MNNVAGSPPLGLGGTDATITIPSVEVSQSDGTNIRNALPANANIGTDASLLSGADANGRLLMYAPNPYASGSSVSHWDTSASPNLLMEPNISDDLGLTTDATLPALRDIGWFSGSTAIPTTWSFRRAAHAQGANNAFYTTSLTVTNTGSAAASVVTEVPRPRPGRPERRRGVADGRRRDRRSRTPTSSGRSSASSSGFGAIRINADTNNLKIVSQTSTPPPSGVGTFGQAVPAPCRGTTS